MNYKEGNDMYHGSNLMIIIIIMNDTKIHTCMQKREEKKAESFVLLCSGSDALRLSVQIEKHFVLMKLICSSGGKIFSYTVQ